MESIRLSNDLRAIPELRVRLRKLRWFVSAFKVHTSLVEQEIQQQFIIDEDRLNHVFFSWVGTVDTNREGADIDLKDFIIYAAGLALASLIRHSPARVHTDSTTPIKYQPIANPKTIHEVWPEGYLYANFCYSVIAALEEQEFGRVISHLHDDAKTTIFWGSFWENSTERSQLALPFLDKMLGKQPNWDLPMVMLERPAMQAALKARH